MNRQKLNTLNQALVDYTKGTIDADDMYWHLQDAKYLPEKEGQGWIDALGKLQGLIYMLDDADRFSPHALEPWEIGEPFTIIGEGNGKLPFLTFSVLPVITCPGAGDCVEFCYSLKAWRYPAAWGRQFQNTLLMSSLTGRRKIIEALDQQLARPKYANRQTVDFRLYVDGDISSVADLDFWMKTIRDRPALAAYGYSKSFLEFLGYHVALEVTGKQWPPNYVLNLSSGHKHSQGLTDAMRSLPIVRGEFVAVTMPKGSTKTPGRKQRQELREAFGQKAFTCPGKCGDCTPKGHACGSMRFSDQSIIIAVH